MFTQERPTSRRAGNFRAGLLAGAVCLGGNLSAIAAPPDFTPDPSAGWFAYTRVFIPPPSGPGPVRLDPAHPRVTNDDFRATGKQVTPAVGDANNPVLQPWAAEQVRRRNARVLAGDEFYSLHAGCWPVGIPHCNCSRPLRGVNPQKCAAN
jgi:hypothetical protein